MATENKCPHCGKPVPTTALGGVCPECMLKAGLAAETGEVGPDGTAMAKPPSQPVPKVEEIAPHFPQLEILECLGRGGMGAVYKARQPKLDRLVALKILTRKQEGGISDTEFAARFQQEARALARLNHPDIVAVYDFGEVGQASSLSSALAVGGPSETGKMPVPLHYLLMEYVDGLTLRQLLQAGKLSPEQALAIVPKICQALQFAHERGIVHRDIKPENILLDKQGQVKIADFGIAKILGAQAGGSALTGVKDVIGTPHYMAPEQVEQPAKVDHRADIYSLGVVFYEMLTGELPLGNFQRPSRKVQVDVRLDEVVLHALEKEPDRRYQHASEVKTDVETIAATTSFGRGGRESTPVLPQDTQSRLTSAAKRSRMRSPWRRAAVTALAVFTIVFGILAIITALLPRSYEAKAKIMVRDEQLDSVRSDGELDWALRDVVSSFRGPLLQDRLVTELNLRERWADRFKTPDLKEANARELLEKQLVIRRVPRTAIFEIGCFSTQPEEAAEIANKAAELLCASPAGRNASVIERATTPTRHARPNEPLNLAFAAAVGLVLGIVFGAGVLLVAAVRPTPASCSSRREEAHSPKSEIGQSLLASAATRRWVTAARWTARVFGTLLLLFYGVFILAEGLPPIASQPEGVQLNFAALGLMFLGFVIGWKREGAAALLIAAGWTLWHISEGRMRWNVFQTPLPVAALYAFCWWATRGRRTGVVALATAAFAVALGLGRLLVPTSIFVRGTVADAGTGAPITEARLTLVPSAFGGGNRIHLADRPNARTDQDGRFTLYVGWYAEGKQVAITAPGYATFATNLGPRALGQRNLSRDFRLQPVAKSQPPAAEFAASVPPVVVGTVPESGAEDVDPTLAEIQVTFSKDMMTNQMWAICQISKDTFPESAGPIHYLDDRRTCVMPVKLQPGKTYVLWFNREQFDSFRDTNNNPSVPYMLIFKTRQ